MDKPSGSDIQSPALAECDVAFCREVEAFGEVCQVRPLSIKWSLSGSTFWVGELRNVGEEQLPRRAFLKHYAARLANDAIAEGKAAARYAAEVQKLGLDHLHVSCPLRTYTLRDGSFVVLSAYVHGEVLMDLIEAGTPLGPEHSERLRLGLLDLAQMALRGAFYHRDINPKNLLLDEDGLWIIDFQFAIPKANPRYENPSYKIIRANCELCADYAPRRSAWNDAFSVLAVFNQIAPLMDLAGAEGETRRTLEAAAKTAPTLQPEYVGDATWKRQMRRVYRKLCLRPLWTCTANSRKKRLAAREVLRGLCAESAKVSSAGNVTCSGPPADDRTALVPKAHAYERWIAGGVMAVVASLVLCAWLPMPARALAMGVIGAAVLGFSCVVAWWRPRTPAQVPIVLMFHTVNDRVVEAVCPNNTVRPAELAHLLADLRAAGYTFQTLSEAFEKPVRRSVVLTFDDGYVDNYTELFPILKAFKAKATCFVTNRGETDPAFLTPTQIREMATSGLVEFGGHTAHHQRLDEVPLAEAEREIVENRAWLERLLGQAPRAFAYPCGGYTAQVVEAVDRAGYTLAATMHKKLRPLATEPLLIGRRIVPRGLRPWQVYLLATRGRFRP